MQAQQTAIREQAKAQQLALEKRLRHQWTLALASMATLLLLILPVLQVVFFSLVRIRLTTPTWFALIVPVAICVLLAVLFARMRANASIEAAKAANKKKAAGQQKAADEKKDAKPSSRKKIGTRFSPSASCSATRVK